MANYVLLQRIELNASASSVTFNNIPQSGYTDLKIVVSARSDYNGAGGGDNKRDNLGFYFNGLASSGNWSGRYLYGIPAVVNGSGSFSSGNSGAVGYLNGAGSTSSSHGSAELYIPNYTSSSYKSVSAEGLSESNASSVGLMLAANLYSNTSPITSVTLFSSNGATFVQYSTFSLYGLAAVGATSAIAPYASGGNSITTDGTYWIHTFNSTGAFVPSKALTCDYLVLAGGGATPYRAAGQYYSGGGGAGGIRVSAGSANSGGGGSLESALSLTNGTAYIVAVGAGGAGGDTSSTSVTNGVNSSISGSGLTAITSIGGGRAYYADANGASGGSGGGAAGNDSVRSGGAGTTGQGYAGGSTPSNNNGGPGAGGGGAASAGGNPPGGNNGAAGNGGSALLNNITGSSVYYGAGGAGMRGYYGNVDGTSGTGYSYASNTGCGGEGQSTGARSAGCSGIVIIRYAV